jgi:hypothetical protein
MKGILLVSIFIKYLNNRTKWNSNPYACGSYSYVDVNCDGKNVFQDLYEPVYVNGVVSKIYFLVSYK